MGSLEEERLLEMVHDYIESEESSSPSYHASIQTQKSKYFNHTTSYFSLQEILKKKTDAETKVLDNVIKHMSSRSIEVERNTSLKKWLVTCLKGDGYHASLCQTSWLTRPGCPSASYDYDYIEIVMEGEDDEASATDEPAVRLIVDIDFKSQFEVARPTASYLELLNTLPTIFVGKEKKLRRVISLLCSAAEESMRERGLHIPPWRTAAYMQSKWFSCCRKKHVIISSSESKESIQE